MLLIDSYLPYLPESNCFESLHIVWQFNIRKRAVNLEWANKNFMKAHILSPFV
jgi:hypothetical protein